MVENLANIGVVERRQPLLRTGVLPQVVESVGLDPLKTRGAFTGLIRQRQDLRQQITLLGTLLQIDLRKAVQLDALDPYQRIRGLEVLTDSLQQFSFGSLVAKLLVKRSAAFDGDATDNVTAIFRKSLRYFNETTVQGIQALDVEDGHRGLMPANHIERHELHLCSALSIDPDEVATAGALLTDGSTLGVAGIDHPGIFAEFGAGMDMTESPVIETGGLQLTEFAGSVGIVTGVVADIAVQQTDLEQMVGAGLELLRQVDFNILLRKADARDRGDRLTVHLDGDGFGGLAKIVDLLGPLYRADATIQRVVIAVHHEGADSGIGKLLETIAKMELCTETAVSAIVNIAGHQKKVHLVIDTGLDESIERRKSRLLQLLRHFGGFDTDPLERTADMQVRRVDEGEGLH